MTDVEIIVPDTPELQRIKKSLSDLRPLNHRIARRAESLTRRHIAAEIPKRHKTADRLGARPTHALNAKDVTSDFDGDGASVTVGGLPFARTFKDVEIKPTGGRRALTIPIHAEAYGKRVEELKGEGWDFFRAGKKEDADRQTLFGRNPSGEVIPMYKLLRSVELKQDRTLLPSDEEYEGVAHDAIEYLIETELNWGASQ